MKFPGGTAAFDLGPQAEKWALKIRNPRSLIDKLGVKPDAKVSVLGIRDVSFRDELAMRTRDVSQENPQNNSTQFSQGAISNQRERSG